MQSAKCKVQGEGACGVHLRFGLVAMQIEVAPRLVLCLVQGTVGRRRLTVTTAALTALFVAMPGRPAQAWSSQG